MKLPWFVRGDVDGFFGLFIDNLLQLMLIATLTPLATGIEAEFVTSTILPAAAISILIGNVFYALQARRLALQTGRADVTALPYGINTPSLIAYLFLIMGPVYQDTKDPMLAWKAGLFACLLSGIMEISGAFVGDWLRRHTPRAALLSALAGIAITFISMGFVFQLFALPAVAVLPMMLILITYASRIRLPLRLPGGLVAVLLGVGMAWILRALGQPSFEPSAKAYSLRLLLPLPVLGDVFALLASDTGWRYMAVIFPMGLFNVIGSLQNLESAEAAGDRFETRPSLLTNGIGTVVAAFLGSPFPTTIYIGHPGWKAMGARHGYSLLNGAVVTGLCLIGGVSLVLKFVPLEATLGILLWIGIIITAQAFQTVPRSHAPAVALGLVPSLAAWAVSLIETALRAAGTSLPAAAKGFGNSLYVYGAIALNQGFLLTAMIFSAFLVFVIEREFRRAALWMFVGALLSGLGIIHAWEWAGSTLRPHLGLLDTPEMRAFAITYALTGAVLLVLHALGGGPRDPAPEPREATDEPAPSG